MGRGRNRLRLVTMIWLSRLLLIRLRVRNGIRRLLSCLLIRRLLVIVLRVIGRCVLMRRLLIRVVMLIMRCSLLRRSIWWVRSMRWFRVCKFGVVMIGLFMLLLFGCGGILL